MKTRPYDLFDEKQHKTMFGPEVNKALNSMDMTAVGINAQALEVSGMAPEWIQLIPAGQLVGRDGREWINDRPELVLDAFAANELDIPLDLEHATELKATQGDPAPAVGWVRELQVRDGQIWGRVEWTEAGRNAVESKSYRYVSPVIIFERTSKRVVALTSVGLTNRPNLFLNALNGQERMDLKNLLVAMGLPESASFDDAMVHLGKLKCDLATATFECHKAQCALNGNRPEDKVSALNAEELRIAEIFGNSAEDLQKYARPEDKGSAMNAEEQTIAWIFGNSAEDLQKYSSHEEKGQALNAEEQRIAEIFGNSAEDLQKYGK